MTTFLFYGIIILNVLFSVIEKKSTIVVLLSFLGLALIMGYASNTYGDFIIYEYNYYSDSGSYWEAGYFLISSIANHAGISFELFRLIVFVLGFSIIIYEFRHFAIHYNLFVSLYSLSLFYFFSVTIRFFIVIVFYCR